MSSESDPHPPSTSRGAASRLRRAAGISVFRLRRLAARRPRPIRDHEDRRIVERFHRLYYDRHESTWTRTTWLGTTVLMCPLDLWAYQEILVETRPDLIVETGTHLGGSAAYLAGVCDLLGNGAIVTIDVESRPGRPAHERVTYVEGPSTSDEVVERVAGLAREAERVMVILDSDHTRDHVLRELELYAPLVTPGCYLVVEDTNVNGHPVLPGFGPGPMEAVTAFLAGTDAFEVDRGREKLLLTFNPSGYLRRRD
jgi:cephalosporin hydroxylase